MLILTRKTGHDDGFGAQYQRIIGVYCICMEFNIPYLHTPLKTIWYQGLQALEKNKNSDEYVNNCNKRINIQSSIDITKLTEIKYMKFANIENMLRLKEICEKTKKNVIMEMEYPYRITDNIENIYKHSKNLYLPKVKKNPIFTIGVHVRRGELYVVDSDRMLPNSYYINIVKKLIKICNECDIEFIVELYTEVSTKQLTITGKHPGICDRIKEDIVIDPKNNKIEDFDVIPNLHKYINEDTLNTYDRMINSDILITSRSCFSCSASYIKSGISIYHKFWHRMMTKDIEVNDPKLEDKVKRFILNKKNTIPKKIYQVWMQGNVPSKIKDNLMKYNKGYEYEFFDEAKCKKYIIENYDESMMELFNKLTNLAHKCDLFRYCLLYKEGGIYVDVDLEFKTGFNKIIEESNNSNFITSLGAHSFYKKDVGECTNGFILTTPKNDIFLKLIDFIKNNPNPKDYGHYVKDFYNKINNIHGYRRPHIFTEFYMEGHYYYLFSEVLYQGKYYIIDKNKRVIINTNHHNYFKSQ